MAELAAAEPVPLPLPEDDVPVSPRGAVEPDADEEEGDGASVWIEKRDPEED